MPRPAASGFSSIWSRTIRPIGTRGLRERPASYVWSDDVPNNWESIFGGRSAWTLDDERGRSYLHNVAPQQPDLN